VTSRPITPKLLLKIARRARELRAIRYASEAYTRRWLADQRRRLARIPPQP
jgi:hypothetical protein